MRMLMQPYTALKLKESKKNQMKDFLSVAPSLGVSHFIVMSKTEAGPNMRMVRVPHGPTITFRVQEFALCRDIAQMHKRPHSPGSELHSSPLVVLNNFTGKEVHKQLAAAMVQNMFPPINVKEIKLSECRRVLLLNWENESGDISFRHFVVNASPVGLTKNIKKLIKEKLPNMHDLEDISDYVFKQGEISSDSEREDTEESRVTLSQNLGGKGNKVAGKSAIRLKEVCIVFERSLVSSIGLFLFQTH